MKTTLVTEEQVEKITTGVTIELSISEAKNIYNELTSFIKLELITNKDLMDFWHSLNKQLR